MTAKKAVAKRGASAPAVVTPINQFDHMIELAITGNADLDKLQKLMDMKVRYDEIEAEKIFNSALATFQSKQAIIAKDQTGHQDKKYASLAGSIAQVQELMTENGLSRSWEMHQHEEKISVTCTITHTSGHSRSATLTAGADMSGSKNAIQGIGSTVTYLERYTFYAALGIASAEMIDDDGKDYGKILAEVVTAADIKSLEKLLKASKADVPKFLDAFLIESLDQLPRIKVAQATAVLNRKIKEQSNDKG